VHTIPDMIRSQDHSPDCSLMGKEEGGWSNVLGSPEVAVYVVIDGKRVGCIGQHNSLRIDLS
jgi:hypothetical protein